MKLHAEKYINIIEKFLNLLNEEKNNIDYQEHLIKDKLLECFYLAKIPSTKDSKSRKFIKENYCVCCNQFPDLIMNIGSLINCMEIFNLDKERFLRLKSIFEELSLIRCKGDHNE